MDRYSFLNAAHTQFFADLYDLYTENPDSVEPSWRAFFQGFDFGMETFSREEALAQMSQVAASGEDCSLVSAKMQKEFNVLKLIDGYRERGHLFTKTNPVRERRAYSPDLSVEYFGLTQADLDVVFDAASVIGKQPSKLREIIRHLQNVYCQSIGVEYTHIRKPEVIEWIQNRLNVNENLPNFNAEQK
jgi:2-oxoglutarate dehydrogenase E1 component